MAKRDWTKNGIATKCLKAQGGKCCYCGKAIYRRFVGGTANPGTATLEHLRPKSEGGTDAPDNIAIACFTCNTNRQNVPWNIYKSKVLGEPIDAPR